jgi:hypothetical protein
VPDTAFGTARTVLAGLRPVPRRSRRACSARVLNRDSRDRRAGWGDKPRHRHAAGLGRHRCSRRIRRCPGPARRGPQQRSRGRPRRARARCGSSALVIWLGTGRRAIVDAGAVTSGRTGTAGSVGHVPVPASEVAGDRRRCTCGAWNHLEVYACGPAITARYVRQGAARDSGEAAGSEIDLPAIASLARAGDPLALSVIEQAGAAIGGLLGGLANVLDPDVIVLGGRVASISDLLERSVRQALASRLSRTCGRGTRLQRPRPDGRSHRRIRCCPHPPLAGRSLKPGIGRKTACNTGEHTSPAHWQQPQAVQSDHLSTLSSSS